MAHVPHRGSERGAALIEFALSWALMWLLFCGAFQFGYAFYVYNALKTSVSGAATLAASLSYDVGQPSTYVTAIQNMAVYGNTAGGSTPLVPSLTRPTSTLPLALPRVPLVMPGRAPRRVLKMLQCRSPDTPSTPSSLPST